MDFTLPSRWSVTSRIRVAGPRSHVDGSPRHLRRGGAELSAARASEVLLDGGNGAVVLADDRIRSRSCPIEARTSTLSRTSAQAWMPLADPVGAPSAWWRDQAEGSPEEWLETYEGGWQLLLPSGGGPSTHRGVHHSYHGEACSLPWAATISTASDGGVHRARVGLAIRRCLSNALSHSCRDTASSSWRSASRTRAVAPSTTCGCTLRPSALRSWPRAPAFGHRPRRSSPTPPTTGPAIRSSPEPATAGRSCGRETTGSWTCRSSRPHRPGRLLLGYLAGFDEGKATIENGVLGIACTLSWDAERVSLRLAVAGTRGHRWSSVVRSRLYDRDRAGDELPRHRAGRCRRDQRYAPHPRGRKLR